MKPVDFEYVRAATVSEALDAIAHDEDAKLLAGGQSLGPMLNLRLSRPSRVVDIGHLLELDRVIEDEDSLLMGALVRHRQLESNPLIRRRLPLLSAAAAYIGHAAIRNHGTVGGSVAHADPAAELPAVMVTLGATLYVESCSEGRRVLPADRFFTSYFTTQLREDEMLTWLRVPTARSRSGWGFVELARRPGDFAMMAAACVLQMNVDGRVDDVRVVLVAAAEVPLLVSVADEARGEIPSEPLWQGLAARWAASVAGGDDADYRRDLAMAAIFRSLSAATRRAEASHG